METKSLFDEIEDNISEKLSEKDTGSSLNPNSKLASFGSFVLNLNQNV